MLTVIAEMGSGGAETVVADLTRHLTAAGHQVGVASDGGWRAAELAREGVPVVGVPLRHRGAGALVRSVARLRRETAARPVDLLHTHNVRATVAAGLALRTSRGLRPPVVTTVHGLAGADYSRAAGVLARTSDVVVAVSEDVAARLTARGLPGSRLRVVENAVATPAPADPDEVRRELGVAIDRPLVLCVARLAAPKRLDLLLDAWREVPEALLVVVGDGPDRAALESRAAADRGGDRICFLGERRDVGRLLRAADLVVLPSDREGLPMTVLEAMAAGVPVVASAVGGVAQLDPAAVELVAPGRVDALAEGVRRLLADADLRAERGVAGRQLVERRYSSQRMLAAYESVYRELLEKRKA